MWTDIRRVKIAQEKQFIPSARRYLLADYIAFMDEFAAMIDCLPPNFCQFCSLISNYKTAIYLFIYYRIITSNA